MKLAALVIAPAIVLAIAGCKKKREEPAPPASLPDDPNDPWLHPKETPKPAAEPPAPVVEPPKPVEPAVPAEPPLPKSDPAAKVEQLLDDVRPMLTTHYGAVIRWFKASYVHKDGTLDPKYGVLEVRTTTPADIVDDPDRPIGAPAPPTRGPAERTDCPTLKFTAGTWTRELRRCSHGEAISLRCTVSEIWDGAIRDRQAPPAALALIERDDNPDAWFFTIEDAPRKILIKTNRHDDCKK